MGIPLLRHAFGVLLAGQDIPFTTWGDVGFPGCCRVTSVTDFDDNTNVNYTRFFIPITSARKSSFRDIK